MLDHSTSKRLEPETWLQAIGMARGRLIAASGFAQPIMPCIAAFRRPAQIET